MARKFNRGWLRAEPRKSGPTWVLRFYTTRASDGKRVEHTLAVGLVRDFPSESSAWAEVQDQHLHGQINKPDFKARVTFGDLLVHYEEHELGDQTEAAIPKSQTTIEAYRRYIKLRIRPRWANRVALSIEPLEVEQWLRELKREQGLANPTMAKTRNVMKLVFDHSIRYRLIPIRKEDNPMVSVRCRTTSDYEAVTITPQQAFSIWQKLPQVESLLVLLAASTGLCISECLGLQWANVDFTRGRIYVRKTWTQCGVGQPKTKASRATVPRHPLLSECMRQWQAETMYGQAGGWVFASNRLRGKKPRVANMIVEDFLRPAAVQAKVLEEGDRRRFGFHTLRHSLATFLATCAKEDPATVQGLLRHADVHTTLQLYAHAGEDSRVAAVDTYMAEFTQSGDTALPNSG